MELDRRLNLVVPVYQDSGVVIYVHSTPIGTEVFKRYFLVIAKTFAAIHQEGLGVVAGPRVAMMLLRKVAEDLNQSEDVERGLIAEIRRLTNVVAPGPDGWTSMPLDSAVAAKMISDEDTGEIENALAFFIVASSMHRGEMRRITIDGAAGLWGAQTTSFNCTEYCTSLKTSTETAATGAKPTLSQVPR